LLSSGKNLIIGANGWSDVGTPPSGGYPSTWVFFFASKWGHIPSSGHMAGCASGPHPSGGYHINAGFFGCLRVGAHPIIEVRRQKDALLKVKH